VFRDELFNLDATDNVKSPVGGGGGGDGGYTYID